MMASVHSHHLLSTYHCSCVSGSSAKKDGMRSLGCLPNFRITSGSEFAACSLKSKSQFRVSPNSMRKFRASSSETAAELESSTDKPSTQSDTIDSNSALRIASEKRSDLNDPTDEKKDKKASLWTKAKKIANDGNLFEGKVEAANSGGLIIFLGAIRCFLPFSQLDPSRLPSDQNVAEVGKGLIGKTITCKIIDLREDEGRIILSEKAATVQKRISEIKEGEIYEGKVSSVTDFGIFVDILFPDGSSPVTGLIHVSEISWDPVKDLQNLYKSGDKVKAKVTRVNVSRGRVSLSIKQLTNDPLYETLDDILPLEGNNDDNFDILVDEDTEILLKSPLPGLANICQELTNENGILEVTVGRMGLERKVVSQDLELWLSNVVKDDGSYTILARAGRQVQEIYVKTELNREEMKNALKWVTSRIA